MSGRKKINQAADNTIQDLTDKFKKISLGKENTAPKTRYAKQSPRSFKGVYFQKRSYSSGNASKQKHVFVRKTLIDWEHLDEQGFIKEEILNERRQFLKNFNLLEDEFLYNNRIVYANKHLYDVHQMDAVGRTNLQRMLLGICPVAISGEDIIVIHHFDQTMKGPWVILTNSFHQNETSHLHSYVHLADKVIRDAFTLERREYWKFQGLAADLEIKPKNGYKPRN